MNLLKYTDSSFQPIAYPIFNPGLVQNDSNLFEISKFLIFCRLDIFDNIDYEMKIKTNFKPFTTDRVNFHQVRAFTVVFVFSALWLWLKRAKKKIPRFDKNQSKSWLVETQLKIAVLR